MPTGDSCLTGVVLMMFLCTNCPRAACKSHRPMARLPPQPEPLVNLSRAITISAMSINPVPTSPPIKAEINSAIEIPPLVVSIAVHPINSNFGSASGNPRSAPADVPVLQKSAIAAFRGSYPPAFVKRALIFRMNIAKKSIIMPMKIEALAMSLTKTLGSMKINAPPRIATDRGSATKKQIPAFPPSPCTLAPSGTCPWCPSLAFSYLDPSFASSSYALPADKHAAPVLLQCY